MTEDEKSPENPSAKRRKTDPKRLERAKRDAARKREKRGGYKSPVKHYHEFLSGLPEDQREASRVMIDTRTYLVTT